MPEKDEDGVKDKGTDAPQTPEEGKTEPETPSTQEVQTDWKQLALDERTRREKVESDRDNYREGMLKYKRIAKGKGREEDAEDDAEDDKPISRKELLEVLRQEVAPIRTEGRLDGLLSEMVTDPAKRDYVRELYQNRIQRTGTSDDAIRTDLETALAIADSKKVIKENSELKRRMENNIYVPPTDGGGNSDKGVERKPYQWTPQQETALEDRARMLGISDVEKYKLSTWKEFQSGTAFAVKPQPKK